MNAESLDLGMTADWSRSHSGQQPDVSGFSQHFMPVQSGTNWNCSLQTLVLLQRPTGK